MAADSGVSIEINWLTLGASEDLNWDIILVTFSVNVNKSSLASVRHL